MERASTTAPQTPNPKFVPFYNLASDIRHIQCLITETAEARIPCLLSGDNQFIVWFVREKHFHPLLNKFPEGFLLVHLSPEFLNYSDENEACNTPSSNDDNSTPKINPDDFEDYIVNECRIPLSHRFYSPILQPPFSPPNVENLYPLAPTSLPDFDSCQNSIEHAGDEFASWIGSYLLSPCFKRPAPAKTNSSFGRDNSDEVESLCSQLKSYRSEQVETPVPDVEPHHRASEYRHSDCQGIANQSFFQFAILERRLIPIPLQGAMIILTLLRRLVRTGRMSLSVPVVLLVNDPPDYRWPHHDFIPSSDKKDQLIEGEQGGSPVNEAAAQLESDHTSPGHNQKLAESRKRTGRKLSWAVYSRRTHSVLYSASRHGRALNRLMGCGATSHHANQSGGTGVVRASETPRTARSDPADHDSDDYYRYQTSESDDRCYQYEIRVPVLPQFNRPLSEYCSGENHNLLQSKSPLYKLSIGDFIELLLPQGLAAGPNIVPIPGTERFTAVPSLVIDPSEKHRMQQAGRAAQLIGLLLGSWRYDIITGSLFSQALHLTTKEDQLEGLITRNVRIGYFAAIDDALEISGREIEQ